MNDLSKRTAITDALKDTAVINLNDQQATILNYLLLELEDLSGITVARNLFYYALGRVLEINVHYKEDEFEHMSNDHTDLKLIYRTEEGECSFTDINKIISDLKDVKPTVQYPLTVVLNFINESMTTEFEEDSFDVFYIDPANEQKDLVIDELPPKIIYQDEIIEPIFTTEAEALDYMQQIDATHTKNTGKNERLRYLRTKERNALDEMVGSFELRNVKVEWNNLINYTLDNNLQDAFIRISAAREKCLEMNIETQVATINELSHRFMYIHA